MCADKTLKYVEKEMNKLVDPAAKRHELSKGLRSAKLHRIYMAEYIHKKVVIKYYRTPRIKLTSAVPSLLSLAPSVLLR